jgi:hypothetical protein
MVEPKKTTRNGSYDMFGFTTTVEPAKRGSNMLQDAGVYIHITIHHPLYLVGYTMFDDQSIIVQPFTGSCIILSNNLPSNPSWAINQKKGEQIV